MSIIISSFLPFPGICWWAVVAGSDTVCLDGKEHFEKMTHRNRYYIAGANGMIQLSIPLMKGRNQRTIMEDVQVSNQERWLVQHWRTLVSVYKRSPYFDHYEPSLQPLFEKTYTSLTDFHLASIQWLKKQLKISFNETYAGTYIKEYGADVADLRKLNYDRRESGVEFPAYYQVFSERTGFLPNMSILDLLFSEGPHTMEWISKNRNEILAWMEQ